MHLKFSFFQDALSGELPCQGRCLGPGQIRTTAVAGGQVNNQTDVTLQTLGALSHSPVQDYSRVTHMLQARSM